MSSPFADKKTCKVLAVDPSGPVRQMMADTLRGELGFELSEGRSTILEALQHLETEKADWIIIPLNADQPVNGLHLLKICTENPQLKGTRVSIFLDQEEQYVIPAAFSHGLFSWHSKPFTKDTFGEELKALLARLEKDGFRDQITSAHYFRQYLAANKHFSMQLALEKGLLELYPGDLDILMNMVEPLHKVGKSDAAKATLFQVRILDEKKAEAVEVVAKALFGEPLPSAGDIEGSQNVLGLGTSVIIDSDDIVRATLRDYLSKLGVTEISDFASGADAWEYLSTLPKEPGLILMEWKIPGLSGPMLLQRIRHHGFATVPIVVVSSLILAEDTPLVKEIGISNVIRKPIRKEEFLPTLIWTIQQERMPTEHQTIERKLRLAIKNGKKDIYEPILEKFLSDPAVIPAKKKLIEAEFQYNLGDYIKARNLSIESIKLSGDSIIALNLLGKAFMRLNDYVSAQKCFEKAQKISPKNIERLCDLAEVKTELGDQAGSTELIEQARKIDADAPVVKEAGVKVAIANGDTKAAKKLMASADALDSLISYMNNKAVSYAKVGSSKVALELYEKTAESIPDGQNDLLAIVKYNTALATIKAGEFDLATKLLEEIQAIPENKMTKKAKSLNDRLVLAIKKGADFKLRTDEDANKANPNAQKNASESQEITLAEQNDKLIQSVFIERGELCCYLIFNNPEKDDLRTVSLLSKPPRFQFRATIEKQEAFGSAKPTQESA